MNNRPTPNNKAASNRGNIGNRSSDLKKIGIKKGDDSMFGELLRHGVDDEFEPSRECVPTQHPPGSLGKIVVLAMRLMRGEKLKHEDDETALCTHDEEHEAKAYVMKRYEGRVNKW